MVVISLAGDAPHRLGAAFLRLAVDQHHAAAALLEPAAEARAHEAELVAQHVEQRRLFVGERNADGFAVDGEIECFRHGPLDSWRRSQNPNCSRKMRSSRLWPGSNSRLIDTPWSMLTSTLRTERTSSLSATAATGRLSASSTSMVTLALSGSSAPRQRRGRNGLIGGERQQRRVDRDDRPLHRQIIGGGAGRRRHQHAVGDQFGEPLLAVDQDAQMRGLRALAEQRHFVDGAVLVHAARASRARMTSGWMTVICAAASRSAQPVERKFVHQEADGAAMHAVDRLAGIHELVQGLQHQPVAAERHDHVGGLRFGIAVALLQPLIGLARLRRRCRRRRRYA